MSENKRVHPRVGVDMSVNVSQGEASVPGTVTDLSTGGAAIQFAPELGKTGFAFESSISMEFDAEVKEKVAGNVVREYDGGVAMEFSHNSGDVLEHLSEIVRDERKKSDN